MPPIFLNPLTDPRYEQFIATHPEATVFHTPAWIRVLHETYGFKPGCVAIVNGSEIRGALPYIETRSITGKRHCVSLPFSDFCEPLFTSEADFSAAFGALTAAALQHGWQNIELRGGGKWLQENPPFATIFTHDIPLAAPSETLFKTFDDTTRRNIRKAEKSGVTITHGSTVADVEAFRRLNLLTRRKHGLPPQPRKFFDNLRTTLLSSGAGFVTLALHAGKPVAANLFLKKGDKALYKYGASDHRFQQVRPANLAMWEGLQACKAGGACSVNLGRTEQHHAGLLRYKRGWNGAETTVNYYNYSVLLHKFIAKPPETKAPMYEKVFGRMPLFLLDKIGSVFYRFAG